MCKHFNQARDAPQFIIKNPNNNSSIILTPNGIYVLNVNKFVGMEWTPEGGIRLYMHSENKTVYKCGFCGKEHTDIREYAKCVNACSVESEKKAKEAERQRIMEEKDARLSQIRAARDYLSQLCMDWYMDYGYHISLPIPSLFEQFFH